MPEMASLLMPGSWSGGGWCCVNRQSRKGFEAILSGSNLLRRQEPPHMEEQEQEPPLMEEQEPLRTAQGKNQDNNNN